ncbi:MAG TPA: helix-turn-helix domain-containing protein [Acidimicrobiia bacterium]
MEQLEFMEIEDIGVFEVLNNTTRFRIIRYLEEPRSIREVADLLDVPPTRLYYHFNLLEEVGVISVVETRKAGAMLQKVYQSSARGFRPSPKMAQGDHEPHELAKITAGVILDGARVDAEEGLTGHFTRVRAGEEDVKLPGSIGRSITFMNQEQAEAFTEKLKKLVEEEFDTDDQGGGRAFGFTYVFFPLAGTGESD